MSSYKQFLGVNQRYWLGRLTDDPVSAGRLWASEVACLDSLVRRGLASYADHCYTITEAGKKRAAGLRRFELVVNESGAW